MSNPPRVRPALDEVPLWTISENPKDASLIRLHLNENPYPLPKSVLSALQSLTPRQLRLFPDSSASELRDALATHLRLDRSQLVIGNGSAEVQSLTLEMFLEPGQRVGYLWPTSPFIERMVQIKGGECVRLDWLNSTQEAAISQAPEDLKILILCSPNPPLGMGLDTEAIEFFAENHPETLVVVDETYEAFRGHSAIRLVRQKFDNIIITRSFSKAYGLAGMRIGYAMGEESLIRQLDQLRPAYNVSVAAQVVALAALRATDWYEETIRKIVATRDRVRMDIQMRGFDTPQSEGNFLWVRTGDAQKFYRELRNRNILVRVFDAYELRDGVRISMGTDEQMDLLISAVDHLVHLIPRKAAPSSPEVPLPSFGISPDLEETAVGFLDPSPPAGRPDFSDERTAISGTSPRPVSAPSGTIATSSGAYRTPAPMEAPLHGPSPVASSRSSSAVPRPIVPQSPMDSPTETFSAPRSGQASDSMDELDLEGMDDFDEMDLH